MADEDDEQATMKRRLFHMINMCEEGLKEKTDEEVLRMVDSCLIDVRKSIRTGDTYILTRATLFLNVAISRFIGRREEESSGGDSWKR